MCIINAKLMTEMVFIPFLLKKCAITYDWYLLPEISALSFFDKNISVYTKREMVKA